MSASALTAGTGACSAAHWPGPRRHHPRWLAHDALLPDPADGIGPHRSVLPRPSSRFVPFCCASGRTDHPDVAAHSTRSRHRPQKERPPRACGVLRPRDSFHIALPLRASSPALVRQLARQPPADRRRFASRCRTRRSILPTKTPSPKDKKPPQDCRSPSARLRLWAGWLMRGATLRSRGSLQSQFVAETFQGPDSIVRPSGLQVGIGAAIHLLVIERPGA